MTVAAGSLAIVGVSLVGGGAASARTEPVFTPSVSTTIDHVVVAPLDLGPVVDVSVGLQPVEVGGDAEVGFVNEPGDDYNWFDGDGCPPCGMG